MIKDQLIKKSKLVKMAKETKIIMKPKYAQRNRLGKQAYTRLTKEEPSSKIIFFAMSVRIGLHSNLD